MKFYSILFLFLLFAVLPSQAVSLKTFEVDSAVEWEQGEPISTAIVEPGQLEAGMATEKIASLEEKPLWTSLWHAKTGQIVIGTGPLGEVWSVAPNGTKKVLAKFKESDVYALAVGPKGELFAGTSPKGKIYRITPEGKEEVYFDPKEEYIWDIAIDASGALYAATGTRGRIYKITEKEKGEIWLDLEQAHIRCLGFDKQGKLLAGTSDGGALYRVTEREKAVVLYDAQKREVRAIEVDASGRIYAGVNRQSTLEWRPSVFQKTPNAQNTSKPAADSKNDETSSTDDSAEAEVTKSKPKPAATKKQSGAGAIYCIQSNGYPQLLGEIPYTIHSLLLRQEENVPGNLVIGTGNAAYLFSVSPDRTWAQLGKIEGAEQITGLVRGSGQAIYLLASNPSQVYRWIQASEARYLSQVVDSKLYARWGRLHVDGAGSWTVRTRSGNTSTPDSSWYPWEALKDGAVQSPQARYLQFEAVLQKGAIERVRLFYVQQNQPPRVEKITVLEPGVGYTPMPSPPTPRFMPQALEQIMQSPTKEAASEKSQFHPEPKPEVRAVAWTASDPNSDELDYAVYLRPKDSSKRKLLLAQKLKEPLLSWDTSGWPEGAYDFIVEASDLPSNAPDETLTSSKASEIFHVDRTAPAIEVLSESEKKIRVRITDRLSLLTEVSASNDGVEYKPILPEDRMLDSSSETFEIAREDASKPLSIRAIDAASNVSGHFFTPK